MRCGMREKKVTDYGVCTPGRVRQQGESREPAVGTDARRVIRVEGMVQQGCGSLRRAGCGADASVLREVADAEHVGRGWDKGPPGDTAEVEVSNFVEEIVADDLGRGTYGGRVRTRFPPEPNGYLHIGHAKSICLNPRGFRHRGQIQRRLQPPLRRHEPCEREARVHRQHPGEDVRWLGFEWDGPERYASDYTFVEKGWAYIDELSAEEISEYRGSLTSPGKDSPYRARSADESLDLLRKMRAGQIDQGKAVLRAKIDMAHQNVIMRDPIMYRILKASHPRTGDAWCIYPSYDFAHGLSDAIEGVTHSVCTLEFSAHNELYDWFNQRVMSLQGALDCETLPRQHEFARLEMTNIVVSKRKLKRLVDEGVVDGWDDPRMPTLSGMRRRGYPACALRRMCQLVGVTKDPNAVIQYSLLESCVRDTAAEEQCKARLLCVLRPLKVTVTNWEGDNQIIEVPAEEGLPIRQLTMGRELFLESEDQISWRSPPRGSSASPLAAW
ncbi:unnamed protein product [Prorocentrum cordatum]|uniref:Glutamyl/glutaminyl-tRNA synthetase class Ib catalytic domain-containing protein n=1 Tax=Prorocentrum cordatum TaxID=2364126 RepID=A0ABN9SE00_9DINO|nr:unnamed protein product [Polarella glacialis]